MLHAGVYVDLNLAQYKKMNVLQLLFNSDRMEICLSSAAKPTTEFN